MKDQVADASLAYRHSLATPGMTIVSGAVVVDAAAVVAVVTVVAVEAVRGWLAAVAPEVAVKGDGIGPGAEIPVAECKSKNIARSHMMTRMGC